MKNLITYLSKKSLSLENGSRLVRDRFEIGSAKSRKSLGSNLSRLCLASLICLFMLTVGVGSAWGVTINFGTTTNYWNTTSSTTFTDSYSQVWSEEHSVAGNGSVTTDASYIQYGNGRNICNSFLFQTTANKAFTLKTFTVTVAGSNGGGTPSSGTIYLMKGTTTLKSLSVSGTSSATCSITSEVSVSKDDVLKVSYSGSKKGMRISQIKYTYEEASCTKKVTITKGTPETGGAFSLDKTGEQNCCSALTVTVSGITAPSGKRFSAITQEGIASGVTIDQSAKTVTYAANSNGSSTINVTFESKGCTDHYGTNVTSGSTQDNKLGPCATYYKYSTRQILYTKTDLNLSVGKKGTIKSISFDYATASDVTRNVTIYMANTSLTSLSNTAGSFVPFSEFTQVYTGSVTFTAGYNEIELSSNYEYNGIGNLVVLIDDNTGSYVTTDYFNTHTASTITGNAQIWTGDDDTNQDPSATSWTGYTPSTSRPNTKFCIQEADMTPATVTLMDDGDTRTQASYEASVTLPSRAGCTGYTFAGWTKTWVAPQSSWTTTAPTIIPAGSYTPEGNENLYPVYTKTEGGGTAFDSYEKVTSAPDDWTAHKYVIATADNGVVLTGYAANYYGGYTTMSTSTEMASYEITVTEVSAGIYKLYQNSKYLALNANENRLYFLDSYTGSDGTNNKCDWKFYNYSGGYIVESPLTYTISKTSGCYRAIQYNTSSGQERFACYKHNTQTIAYLYMRKETSGSTTYYISVPACCTDWSTPTVTYSSSLAINASEGVTIDGGTTHGAVTYESSDEDVLTVDADGTIHAVGAGTAHIIATWAGDATYCEKSANSNDVTVSGIQVTGTTPVNFGQVYQNAAVADKTIYVTGLGLANPITPSLPAASPFSFSPASLAKDCSGATLTISASTATIGDYNQTLTLTSGAFSATVTIKMEVIAKPTATFTDALHGLTEDENGVSLSSYNLTAAQGTAVVFPTLANQTKSAGTCEGEYYIFVGWTEGDNNTDPEDHLVTSHTLANGDAITYHAVWADGTGTATYTKLTSNSFSGSPAKYVLGAEHEGTTYYFSDYDPDEIAYDLDWGTCSSSDAPIQFTLSGTASALVAKDNLNNYLEAPCTTKAFYISASETSVELKSDGTIYNNADGCTSYRLRYNSSGPGLRWYTTDTGDPAYFYLVGAAGTVHYRTSCCANKVDAPVVTATAVTSTSITLTWPSDVKATGWQIEWNGAGGWVTPSGSCTHTVSGLTPNTTYTWRVRATYEDPVCGADVRSGSTTTNQVYHVTYAKGSGTGTCTATGSTTDETGYEAGATVTLQDNGFSLAGHTFAGWTEDDEDITISSNQFTMPDHDVVITASWTAKMDKYFDRMHDQTDALHGGVEETEGTNEGKYYIPKEGCNYSIPTAVDSKTGDACQTSHYKLRGWIAASYVNSKGEITDESKIFSPGTTKTAGGYTYYAVWAEVVE